jgi:hypothetical protein
MLGVIDVVFIVILPFESSAMSNEPFDCLAIT